MNDESVKMDAWIDRSMDQLLTLIPGWACFFYLMYSMTDDAEIKGFDPFAILGVTPSTEERDIKKQYRALSLIYHPDKVSHSLVFMLLCPVLPLVSGTVPCTVPYRDHEMEMEMEIEMGDRQRSFFGRCEQTCGAMCVFVCFYVRWWVHQNCAVHKKLL